MSFDWISILQAAYAAAKPLIANTSKDAQAFVKMELAGFAHRVEEFGSLVISGDVKSMDEAKAWLAGEIGQMKVDLAIAEGIGEIIAEQVANAQMTVGLAVLGALPKAIGL